MQKVPLAMRSASARDRGLGPGVLDELGYTRLAHDVYVAGWLESGDPMVRLAVALEMATAAVTIGGWAAARIHEDRACPRDDTVRVFDGRRPVDEPVGAEPVLVLASPEARIVARPGQRVFRSRVPDEEREPYGTGSITTPLRTAFDIARLSSRTGGVVALDRLLSLGLVRADDLRRMIAERPRWRGLAKARRALSWADEHVRSPMETVMRLDWLAAGLPRPRCNAVVEDLRGQFVAMVDLLDERTGLVGEYDGGYHASAEQRRSDAGRRERMAAVGLTVVTMTAADQRGAERRRQWRERLVVQRRMAARALRGWRLRPAD